TATCLLFLTAWIVIPGWTYPVFNLSVGAPEFSPWLLLVGLILCISTLTVVASTRLSHVAFTVGIVACIAASIPLTRAPAAIRRFDSEMQRALGDSFLTGVSAPALQGMRERPVAILDLFRGVDFGDARVDADIPFAAPGGQPLTLTVYRPKREG